MDQPFSNLRSLFTGLESEIPLLGGETARYIHLDNAATTPPLRGVVDTLHQFTDWYGSVHRGSGYKSWLSSDLYEHCRQSVADFIGANLQDHAIVFCCNTTDAINKLARMHPLRSGEVVLCTLMEHHSNMLPWRCFGERVEYAPVRRGDGSLDVAALESKLKQHAGHVPLVCVTGASNVTGAIPPLAEIARLAHRHGARLLVDAAQLAAHRPIRMGSPGDPEAIDFLAFSAHKMYAPYGGGALVGPRDFFRDLPPAIVGGGSVNSVTLDVIDWAKLPERLEAGSPNLIGALALAKAVQILDELDMEKVAEHERRLTARALQVLERIQGVRIYGDRNPQLPRDRVGVIPFRVESMDHALVAAVLGCEWGIGVRQGCFCAHPYVIELLGLNPDEVQDYVEQARRGDLSQRPGFVRVSLGLHNTAAEIEHLADALAQIVAEGPRGRYTVDPASGEYAPEGYAYDLDAFLASIGLSARCEAL